MSTIDHAGIDDSFFQWHIDQIPDLVPRDEAAARVANERPYFRAAHRRWIRSGGASRPTKPVSSPPSTEVNEMPFNASSDAKDAALFEQRLTEARSSGQTNPDAMRACGKRYPALRMAWVRHRNRQAGVEIPATT